MSALVVLFIVVVVFVIVLIAIGAWWFLDYSGSPQPLNPQAVVLSTDKQGSFHYRFSWESPDTDVSYVYNAQLLDSNRRRIDSVETTSFSWEPNTSFHRGSRYYFQVTARDSPRKASEPVSISFEGGKNAGKGDLSEVFVVSRHGNDQGVLIPFPNTACRDDSNCPTGYTCQNNSCQVPNEKLLSFSSNVCQLFGGRIASGNDMKIAYENGADWCSYTMISPSAEFGNVNYMFPCYDPFDCCSHVSTDNTPTTPTRNYLEDQLSADIACYGPRPSKDTVIAVPNVFEQTDIPNISLTVKKPFSKNLNLESMYDQWDGTSKYGCTKPGETCHEGSNNQ